MAWRRLIFLATASILPLAGEERFPPPDFGSGYGIPSPTVPAVRAEWLAVLDLGLLAAALALAAWAVRVRRSRTAIAWIAVGSLLWFGFVRQGCTCSIGAIQDVAHAAAAGGGLSWVAAGFFLLPLLAALAVGRVFCAGVCPLGAIQDLVLVRPLRLPAGLEAALGLLPYAYLALAVLWAATGAAYVICAYDPFVGFFRLAGPLSMLVAGGGLLLLGTVVGRPYCRFLCPYGVLLGWLARLARWPVRIHPTGCVNCRLCEESCPFGALHVPPPPTAQPPPPPRRLIAGLALAAPLLLALGAWLGWHAGGALARRHATVALADALAAGRTGDAVDAFRSSGRAESDLLTAADAVVARTRLGAAAAGAFLAGAVVLILLRRCRRPALATYEAEPAACVACGRCLPACPVEPAPAGGGA